MGGATMPLIPFPAHAAQSPGGIGPLGSVLALPVTQLQLVRSILGAEQATSGSASAHQGGLVLSVAAAGSASYTNTVPDRYNWLLAAPMRVTSTYYDPSLTITVAVDDPTNVVIIDYPLMQAAESVIAEFGIVRRQLFLTIVNGTTTACQVMFDTQYAAVLESVVNDVWIPTLTGDFSLLQARARALVAQGYALPGVA